jgi:pyruvate-formate lyase-activating enzyme
MNGTEISTQVSDFPSIVQLSITNVCDMQCSHCPHSTYARQANYRAGYMSLPLYRKIAAEVGAHRGTIRIFGWGEALLHPDLVEMVAYAKSQQVEFVNLITNGLKLNEALSRGLLNAGLDVLEVSLDAFTDATYRKIRRNAHFAEIKANIFNFLRLREELKGCTYVAVGIIDQPKAAAEIEAFNEFWSHHVDDVVLRKYRDFKGYVSEPILLPTPRYPCRCLWARFNINHKGQVSVCYDDWQGQHVLADMNESGTTIAQVWRSQVFYEFRKSHLEGKPFGICATCNDWIASSWSQPYEDLLERVKQWQASRRQEERAS